MKQKEVWKDIKDFEGLYQVSNLGNVRNYKTKKLKIPHIHDNKYLRITLYNKSSCKHKKVHRLVAEAFVENPLNKLEVNHIDLDKYNNNASNLEWVTGEENINHYLNHLYTVAVSYYLFNRYK